MKNIQRGKKDSSHYWLNDFSLEIDYTLAVYCKPLHVTIRKYTSTRVRKKET